MARNTIGQFIAALRKANGLTQQEVADRLNVSNKAVSRWERDECTPDISLIPALAELLGVTCDELLKGERIPVPAPAEKREPKIEKQVRNLINRTLSSFRTRIWISVTVAILGIVCMFGISYGFFRPVIGFAVMLLLEVCAFGMVMVAANKAKDVTNENELFGEAEEALTAKFSRQLGGYSFTAFFVIAASILLSLPLVLWTSDYVDSVLSIGTYLSTFFIGIVLILALGYLKLKAPYVAWITGDKRKKDGSDPGLRSVRRMNGIQLGSVGAASLIFLLAPYLVSGGEDNILQNVLAFAVLGLLAAGVVCFAVFLLCDKENRKRLILPGIRNVLLTAPAFLLSWVHTVGWVYEGDEAVGSGSQAGQIRYERYDIWRPEYIWLALGAALLIFTVFAVIDALQKRKK